MIVLVVAIAIAAIAAAFAGLAALFAGLAYYAARDADEKSLRAYVSVAAAGDVVLDGQMVAEVPLLFRDTGQTPAYKLALAVDIHRATPEDAMSWTWHYADPSLWKTRIGFLADSAIKSFAPPEDRPVHAASMKEDEVVLYARGLIVYDDIYQATRWTSFCLWWPADHLTQEDAQYCDKGNETEETMPGLIPAGIITIIPR